jgi:hypothetical protein
MAKLVKLDLRDNQLQGQVPLTWSQLESLSMFEIGNNTG